jgi:hypothetical protein
MSHPILHIPRARSHFPLVLLGALLLSQCNTVAHADPPPLPRNTAPAADAPRAKAVKPTPRVTISKETTWITEPLREDGYPDYVRYLNEKLSQGVTPQNNAIVPLTRTMGLSEVDEKTRNQYCKLLGIDPLPENGNYFERWESYAARTPEADQPAVPAGDKRTQQEYFDQLVEIAAARPWTREEFPHLAIWLEANERHIDAIVRASQLPRAFSPLLFDESSSDPQILSMAMVLDIHVVRDAAQAVSCRAMLHAAEQNLNQAFDDLLACHRFARLVGSRPGLNNFLTAKQIECQTIDACVQACSHAKISTQAVRELRAKIKTLPRLPRVAESYVFHRLEHLDAACYLAREGWHTLFELTSLFVEFSGDDPPKPSHKPHPWLRFATAPITWLVQWDEPLKLGNEWHDRLVRIAQMDDPREQSAELDAFDKDLHALLAKIKEHPTRTGFYFYPRRFPTNLTSRALVGLFLPALDACIGAGHYLESYRSMFDLALALAEYRAVHDDYPSTLQKLIPKYIKQIPADDFSGSEFAYRKTDDGYHLYSLGKNGRDDGGKTQDEDEDADDVVVSVRSMN